MYADFPPVLSLRVTLATAEPQVLPPFLGSALHGALGRALYKTVCTFPRQPTCTGCPLVRRCSYPALFQTPAPQAETLRAAGIRDQAPRPLVLAPDAGWTRSSGKPFRLKANTDIPFRITLIGRAIDDVAVMVVALQTMSRRGLGIPLSLATGTTERNKRRASAEAGGTAKSYRPALRLACVSTTDGAHAVYDGASDAYTPSPQPPSDVVDAAERATFELVTPLRLKHSGRFANTLAPVEFFCALARRANALGVLHGSGLAVNETEVAGQAAEIRAEHAALRLVHVTRYSATQRQRMQWPGLMGRLRWHGAGLPALWPLLRFGELVQVGKGATLGFGRYQVVAEP